MNALVDAEAIRALYRASQAGVDIDLLVRGICCLRPGIPGISDRIRVTSIVDRFLEHSRIFYFEAGGREEVYLSSADWMPRNFNRRVEILFPVEDLALRARLKDELLATMLNDNVKARRLRSDGSYERVQRQPGEEARRSQEKFLELAKQKTEPELAPEVRLRLALHAPRRDASNQHLPAVLAPRPEGARTAASNPSALPVPLTAKPS